MSKALKLVPGAEAPEPSAAEIAERIEVLRDTIAQYLPNFVKAVENEAGHLIIHQDAFAAGYDHDEFILLGMAIKYAGLVGKEVNIIGRCGETFRQPTQDPAS